MFYMQHHCGSYVVPRSTPCKACNWHSLGYFVKAIFSTATKYAVSNFTLSLPRSWSPILENASCSVIEPDGTIGD